MDFNMKEETRLIASHIPESLYEHLGLLSVESNTSRSQLVLDLLKDLLVKSTPEKLIRKITKNLLRYWKENLEDCPWRSFLSQVRSELRKKKLSDQSIASIMKGLKQSEKSR